MNYLSYEEILKIHEYAIKTSGGSSGIRDEGLLESAVNQPRQSYGGVDLYVTITAKAAALGFSLIKNHAFVDGNKRAAFLSIGLFLFANGWKLTALPIDAIRVMLFVANGDIDESELAGWIEVKSEPI